MTPKHPLAFLVLGLGLLLTVAVAKAANTATILGWNNLGMHCMDSRYAEFSILPPYNSFDAQLIVNGKLIADSVTASNYSITYEAIPDPAHTQVPIPWLNSTSQSKTDFWSFAPILGLTAASLPIDAGLAGCNMPGQVNTPQPMSYESGGSPVKSYHAEGVPITPYNDDGVKNTYPMVRIKAWLKPVTPTSKPIAQTDIVLPVSDEMTCKSCHASNSHPAAMPTGGWVTGISDPDREYRLNILKLHDSKQAGSLLYQDALSQFSLGGGLYQNALNGKPALCASCHGSNALGTSSFSSANGTVPALTVSVHGLHAGVTLPNDSKTLDDSSNRDACYTCHPGSATKCLRGAMGSAVANDGSMAMQCQSCHGKMSDVGAVTRTGWLDEPSCQNCHTGTATANNGQIRYLSVFEAAAPNTTPATSQGNLRPAVNQTFATNPDTPLAGKSLYRFSKGHGELQCSACHGSTHAEFPSSHASDNARNIALQGHVGVNIECKTCHTSNWTPSTPLGGPHGMHSVDQNWVNSHHDAVSQTGLAACQSCHGADSRGTVLSRVQGDRSFNDKFSQKFYRGATVGCYSCHNGPSSSNANTSLAPVTAAVSGNTLNVNPLDLVLPGNSNGVSLRILMQPQHGTVGLNNGIATYFPDAGYVGSDSFTFAGYDGSKNSYDLSNPNLPAVTASTATVTVGNGAGPAPANVLVSFTQNDATPGVVLRTGDVLKLNASADNALSYQWFKDGWLLGSGNPYVINSASPNDNGRYVVLALNASGATASKTALQLNVLTPPAITAQPLSQTVNSGVAVSFSVVATGSNPLTYQWFKNGVTMSGKTSATLNLSAVNLAAAANYTVTVSNAAGSVTSDAATLTVNEAPKITTQPLSQTVNQGATVNLSVVATGNPALSYQWYKNGLAVGTNAATLSLPNVQISDAGAYTVTISNTLGSVSSNTANLVVKALTSASLSSSLNPAPKGSPVILSLAVTGNNPTGTVTFKNGATTLGSAALAGGVASITTSTLAAGARTITASYPGDALNQPISATLLQTVVAQTTTTVKTSAASAAYGSAIKLTATISGGVSPTGTVDFRVDGNSVGVVSVAAGSASLTPATPLAAGSHSVVAIYSGDAGNSTSTSATITQTITKLSPKTVVSSSAATVKTGTAVTLTATLSGAVGPTGSITFNDKLGTVTTVLGSVAVSAGKAAITVTTLAKGKHSITAVYGGDGNHNASTSSAFTQTMN